MGNNEIKALIEKYKLTIKDGKLGTYARVNKADFMREVPPLKEEIKAYILAEQHAKERAAHEKYEREYATFYAIPGVKEISEARRQAAKWWAAFNEMMETGSSEMPPLKSVTPDEMRALEEKYPMAVFALEAKRRAATTENLRLGSIWATTYQAILDGQDVATVKADHEARMQEYKSSVI